MQVVAQYLTNGYTSTSFIKVLSRGKILIGVCV